MSKLLKKVHINPLINFGLREEKEQYDACQTDEELASFYHKLLSRFENRPLLTSFLYAMIGYSIGGSVKELPNSIKSLL